MYQIVNRSTKHTNIPNNTEISLMINIVADAVALVTASLQLKITSVPFTVELPNNGHIGSGPFVLYIEVVHGSQLC